MGIGFSFTEVSTAAGLALVIVIGSAFGLVVSMLWPAGDRWRGSVTAAPEGPRAPINGSPAA